ncbi:MAG TPA: GNAT family protein [Burkholderiales bacterium]|nr:GNAT family protein [Burkholderiales bacterium]
MRAQLDEVAQVLELGTEQVVLRPVRAEDRAAYVDFISRIDPADLRRRFFDAHGLSPQSDFEHHVRKDRDGGTGFVAVRQLRGSPDEIVGEARVHRYPGVRAAELAIIVRSDMQRRGLGRALMQKAIEYCAAHGMEVIARMLPDNDAMIGLAKRSGMQVEHAPDGHLAIAHLPAA